VSPCGGCWPRRKGVAWHPCPRAPSHSPAQSHCCVGGRRPKAALAAAALQQLGSGSHVDAGAGAGERREARRAQSAARTPVAEALGGDGARAGIERNRPGTRRASERARRPAARLAAPCGAVQARAVGGVRRRRDRRPSLNGCGCTGFREAISREGRAILSQFHLCVTVSVWTNQIQCPNSDLFALTLSQLGLETESESESRESGLRSHSLSA
jgi:hypothetical protein